MKDRLERSGQRSISALVDISNYVMLELGRPTHIFDLDKLDGPLTVRWGKEGEKGELLNGQTVDIDPYFGVISDNNGIEAIAGIMGGDHAAVSLETKNVFIEAAFAAQSHSGPLQKIKLLDRCCLSFRARCGFPVQCGSHGIHHSPDPRDLRYL